MRLALPSSLLGVALLASCIDNTAIPEAAGVGERPALPAATHSLIPTLAVAPAEGWPVDQTPTPAPGLTVTAFARGLEHPRWLLPLPNGDVLVAESNAQPKPPRSLREFVQNQAMRIAGAKAPSADRISLLRDADGDGEAEMRTVLVDDLTSPFGMALVGDALYVADTDALLRFSFRPGETRIRGEGQRIADLPAGDINHHWTKGLTPSADGRRLFVSVGSNSDHGENGLAAEAGRAAIWEVDPASGSTRVYASGLRNPVGLDIDPATGQLWAVVNERDELGGDLVPDYLTAVRSGGFYGWPWSYWGAHPDPRVEPPRPDLAAEAIVPDYALGSHVAPLGLSFADGSLLGPRFAHGAFVGLHGSWNRQPRSGYKVIFVPFQAGHPSGKPVDLLTGFLDGSGKARGRPVGVAVDGAGALLVADDVGNAIWRVAASDAGADEE